MARWLHCVVMMCVRVLGLTCCARYLDVDAFHARIADMASALFEFGLSFTLLGQDEKDALGNALARLGKTSDTLSVYATKHADAESMYFEDPIKDYIRLVASVKAALGQRTETRGALRAALTELENKRLAVTRLRGSGKDRQLIEAEAEVKKAEEEVEAAKTTHETVNDRVLTELERFKREKLADIKNVVLDYVQIQIDYNKKVRRGAACCVVSCCWECRRPCRGACALWWCCLCGSAI